MDIEVYDPLRIVHEFSVVKLVFGIGAVDRVGALATKLTKGKKCLVITDRGVEKANLVEKVTRPLEKEGFEVTLYVVDEGEPTTYSISKATDFARKEKFDLIVGVGGGSTMDTAKVVGRTVTNPGDPKMYLSRPWENIGIPVIAVPTTAGTGAEMGDAAVVTLSEENLKDVFRDTAARLAIVDPLLCLTMPPKLTASTGIDALSHAIESLLSSKAFPLTETLSLKAIEIISKNLRRATYHGEDLESRYYMSLAATIAAFPDQNVGCVEGHAIAHLIGPRYRIPHGVACGIALPYIMEYHFPVDAPKIVEIARVMVCEDIKDDRKAVCNAILAVKQLIEDVNLPTMLKQIEGVNIQDLEELVRILITSPRINRLLSRSKRKMTEQDALKLFHNMWNGKLEILQ